jgi:Cft2 family RNA processing exonuclease
LCHQASCFFSLALQEVSDFDLFELNDIDKAFTKTVNTVKHHQPVELVLQGTALRIVGYPAGHMLGGTVWVLEAGSEVVVYGVDTNHNKER